MAINRLARDVRRIAHEAADWQLMRVLPTVLLMRNEGRAFYLEQPQALGRSDAELRPLAIALVERLELDRRARWPVGFAERARDQDFRELLDELLEPCLPGGGIDRGRDVFDGVQFLDEPIAELRHTLLAINERRKQVLAERRQPPEMIAEPTLLPPAQVVVEGQEVGCIFALVLPGGGVGGHGDASISRIDAVSLRAAIRAKLYRAARPRCPIAPAAVALAYGCRIRPSSSSQRLSDIVNSRRHWRGVRRGRPPP